MGTVYELPPEEMKAFLAPGPLPVKSMPLEQRRAYLIHYALTMQDTYGVGTLETRACELCGTTQHVEHCLSVRWEGTIHIRKGMILLAVVLFPVLFAPLYFVHFLGHLAATWIDGRVREYFWIETVHAVCGKCRRRVARHDLMESLASTMGLLALIVSLVAAFGFGFFAVLALRDGLGWRHPGFLKPAAGVLASMFAGILLHLASLWLARRLRLPQKIRILMKAPFVPTDVELLTLQERLAGNEGFTR